MRYVSAYLLAVLGGNASPKVDDLKNILAAVGVDTDAETAELVVKKLRGKTVEELINAGASGLVSVSGGCTPATDTSPVVETAVATSTEDKSSKKEEKEESDDDMGFGLFD
uniref:Large ribosomal subunit protein P2 n=1 Tax=Heterorhabditis bacteriophora TaxID=37862 RepID=A0A1I7X7T8_HETBA